MTDRLEKIKKARQAMAAAANAFVPHYTDLTQQILQEEQMAGGDWFSALLAHGVAPEPLTLDYFCALNPFVLRQQRLDALQGSVERGFLSAETAESYRLTDKGRNALLRFYRDVRVAIANIKPLPAAEMAQLTELMERIVSATRAAPEPADKRFLTVLTAVAPAPDAPDVVRFEQCLTDLALYRDDAHNAVVAASGASGRAWEALTYIWRGDADTVATLMEKLEPRGVDEAGWTAALQENIERGWLTEENGRYALTPAGQTMRDEAEAQTNANHFVGWAVLSDAEIEQLEALLAQAAEALKIEEAAA